MSQAVVIVERGDPDGENHLVIGPFPVWPNINAASDWAFKNLPVGTQWYWLPIQDPSEVNISHLK